MAGVSSVASPGAACHCAFPGASKIANSGMPVRLFARLKTDRHTFKRASCQRLKGAVTDSCGITAPSFQWFFGRCPTRSAHQNSAFISLGFIEECAHAYANKQPSQMGMVFLACTHPSANEQVNIANPCALASFTGLARLHTRLSIPVFDILGVMELVVKYRSPASFRGTALASW